MPLDPTSSPNTGQRLDERWITAESLAPFAPGTLVVIPPGASVTAHAQDEADRLGIRLVEEQPTATKPALKLAIACDHGGFGLKRELLAWMLATGQPHFDLGSHSTEAVDYPDYARAVAEAVRSRRVDVGICIDTFGSGSAITANKVPGVRAANAWSPKIAASAREHNHANMLTLGAADLPPERAIEIVQAFLAAKPSPGRHANRVEKISALERR